MIIIMLRIPRLIPISIFMSFCQIYSPIQFAVCNIDIFYDSTYGSRRPGDGKMEKSFINFQQVHPNWRAGSGGGGALLEKVQSYRAAM